MRGDRFQGVSCDEYHASVRFLGIMFDELTRKVRFPSYASLIANINQFKMLIWLSKINGRISLVGARTPECRPPAEPLDDGANGVIATPGI